MSKATVQHPNASLTPRGRAAMVKLVTDQGWPISAAAERYQVDPKTVRKWRDRYLEEGPDGLLDRSSRPRRSPARTPDEVAAEVRRLRVGYRWGPARIGYQTGLAASTVHRIITDAGLGRLDQGDRAAPPQVVRYQRERPGELVHIDIKKLAGIPDGGGWHAHGRGRAGPSQRVGYRYIHSALDDRTRAWHAEIHRDETAATAAGFLERTVQKFNRKGIQTERVLTDNGPCYRSGLWAQTCARLGVKPKHTRPYRPQTNGKIERFHRTLLEEWAYIQPWTSEQQRHEAFQHYIHYYNHHRPHGALGWATPIETLQALTGDNLPELHN